MDERARRAEVLLTRRTPWQLDRDIDTRLLHVDHASMTTKVKRTYNLSVRAVEQVRELASRPHQPASQDGIVEEAIARYYREEQEREENAAWDRAAGDAQFQHEMAEIRAAYGDREDWPA